MPENILGFITGLTLGLLIVVCFLVAKMHAAVKRIEFRLNTLLKQSGVDANQVGLEEVKELAKAGRKIEAIKLYRELNGVGLAEAKDAVERLTVT